MKYASILFFLLVTFSFQSCKDDNTEQPIFDYHAHIHQPITGEKYIGDTLDIDIEFESHTGQPVHHINVRIFRKSDNTVVYDKPNDPHVHATSGSFVFDDQFVLSEANGLTDGDWVLIATVWGESDGEEETSERIEFKVRE